MYNKKIISLLTLALFFFMALSMQSVLNPINSDVNAEMTEILTSPDNIHPYDKDEDWVIGDIELLEAIDDWAAEILGDFELLDIIDFWAAKNYCWDSLSEEYKADCVSEISITVGSEGGSFELTDPDDFLFGAKLTVPAGAIAKQTAITLRAQYENLGYYGLSGNTVVTFEPSGIYFGTPLILELPVLSGYNSNDFLMLVGLKNNSQIIIPTINEVFVDNGKITVYLYHFSTYSLMKWSEWIEQLNDDERLVVHQLFEILDDHYRNDLGIDGLVSKLEGLKNDYESCDEVSVCRLINDIILDLIEANIQPTSLECFDDASSTCWIPFLNSVLEGRYYYWDLDGDGRTPSQGDCLDSNKEVHPGVEETCDNLDNNCDGEIDENLMQATSCGVGECSDNVGEETCTAGAWGGDTCDPLAGATAEICDNRDNNCDGNIDENVTQATTCGVGQCGSTGEKTCAAGVWGVDSCTAGTPAAEICDNLDNNCDGTVDEGCDCVNGTTRSCGSDTGECVSGTESCIEGVWSGVCSGEVVATAEVCDNRDNNCDGNIDENLTQATSCGVGECSGNVGEETCTAGAWGGNTCDPLAGATAEICDGLDNDCNALTADGSGEATPANSLQDGVCVGSAQSCTLGAWTDDYSGLSNYEATEVTCDSVDNDCDVETDEG